MKQARVDADELLRRSRMAGLLFIRVEIEFLVSMLDCAKNAMTPERREQCLADANKAAQTVRRLLPRLGLDEQDEADIGQRLAHAADRQEGFASEEGTKPKDC